MQHACTLSKGLCASPASLRRPAPCSRRTSVRVAAKSADGVPPNVAEARAWISAWKAKQTGSADGSGSAAAAAPSSRPSAAAASSNGAGKANKLAPCKSFDDGTLLFTADALKSVNVQDVLKKQNSK